MVLALPSRLDGQAMLAAPARTDIHALARAWFPAAAWDGRPPGAPDPAPADTRPVGARFRGLVEQRSAPAEPAAIRLDEHTRLVGPVPLTDDDALRAGVPRGGLEWYALEGEASVQARRWLVAAARHTGGLVVPADRSRVMAPDPEADIDLTLWSPIPLTLDEVLPLARPAMSGARVSAAGDRSPAAGPRPFEVVAEFEYDGSVALRVGRSNEPPAVLATLEWRDFGPWAYRVEWRPLDPAERDVEHPSRLHVIARQRVAPTIARVAGALWRAAGGTVVSGGGFVVGPREVARRATAAR